MRSKKPASSATKKTSQVKPVSDLPKISAPAIRALASIGVTTRAQVAKHTEAELLALHGFGPTGIRILREAGVTLKR